MRREHAPAAWTILAHALGAAAIGGLDCARLRSSSIAIAVVPMFAVTGILAGIVIAGFERLVRGRHWAVQAAVIALPTLVVTAPVAATLFDGPYARTLPYAEVGAFVLPVVAWLGTALVIAIGRRLLRDRQLISRSIAVLFLAGAVGGLVWVERHVLGAGYPQAHVGGTLAVLVIAGAAVRVTRARSVHPLLTALAIGLAAGSAAASVLYGLHAPEDRQRIAVLGDQSRDLVHVWSSVIELSR